MKWMIARLSMAYTYAQRMPRLRKDQPLKKCEGCGIEMLRRRWSDGRLESPQSYSRRQFHSNDCRWIKARKTVFNPTCCRQCQSRLTRKRFTRGRESRRRYRGRQFCDRECWTLFLGDIGNLIERREKSSSAKSVSKAKKKKVKAIVIERERRAAAGLKQRSGRGPDARRLATMAETFGIKRSRFPWRNIGNVCVHDGLVGFCDWCDYVTEQAKPRRITTPAADSPRAR